MDADMDELIICLHLANTVSNEMLQLLFNSIKITIEANTISNETSLNVA